jgi:hypothetical protein
MSPRTIRRIVVVVFVLGIAGMIIGSIADDNGVAVTFGLITAAAAVGLILVTSAAGPDAFQPPGASAAPVDQEAARSVEEQVGRLVDAGANEVDVRELVRRAVTLGRGPRR